MSSQFLIFICIIKIVWSESELPNFVVILADDMGWGDPSYNNGTVYTPYLDEWTKESHTITFNRGYAGAPVCSPTRASILTGRTPNRDCIYDANGCGSLPAWNCSEPMPLPLSVFTIAQAVKKAYNNYSTALFGKWHLGDFWVKQKDHGMSNPGQHGFDTWFATEASAPSVTTNCGCFMPFQGCVTGHYSNGPWCTNYWYPNISSPIGVSNLTEKIPAQDTLYLVNKFEEWLEDHHSNRNSDPFLVMLWLHPVHVEFLATDEFREACANGTVCPASNDYSSAQLDYFGDIAELDQQIYRVRQLLKQYNYYDNTLLYFTSDNGPEGDGAGPYGNSEWPGSPNGLRGRKRDVWEGGIREPTIISWPAMINQDFNQKYGFNSTYPIVTYDLLPTIMDYFNITSNNPTWPIDGYSWLNLFKNGGNLTERPKPMGWQYHDGIAYTNNSWKVVYKSHDCSGESCNWALYNINDDPNETINLTSQYPDIYQKLHNQAMNWVSSVNASQYYDSGCKP